MQQYLTSKGYEVKKGTEKNKDSLISQIKSSWFETEEQASESYNSVKDWIFDRYVIAVLVLKMHTIRQANFETQLVRFSTQILLGQTWDSQPSATHS